MRDYTGIIVSDIADPSLRDKLARVDYFLRDLNRALGRLQAGEVPDGSGDPIGSVLDDGLYLKLKGRIGGQSAHGGIGPGSTLTLSSTLSSTKGSIFLGDLHTSVYDEVNDRVGVGQAAPQAKVHIKVAASSGTSAVPTSGAAGNSDWSNQGGAATIKDALSDSLSTTYAQWDSTLGFNSTLQGNLTGSLTNPGGTSGYSIKITAAATHTPANSRMNFVFKSGAAQIKNFFLGGPNNTATPAEANMTGSQVTYTINLTAGDVANMDFAGGQPFTYEATFSGLIAGPSGGYQISRVELSLPPIGGVVGDTLQEWENPTSNNTLSYANDSNSQLTLQIAGTPPLRLTTAPEFDVGTPAVNDLWHATDTEGTGAWVSVTGAVSAYASAFPVLMERSFVANGPYRTGDEVDGVWDVKRAMTLSYVRLHRRKGGTSGSTQVTVTKNGVTMLSADPTIAFNAGASASADGTISVTTIAAGDRIAASAVAVDTGLPPDASWTLMVGAF